MARHRELLLKRGTVITVAIFAVIAVTALFFTAGAGKSPSDLPDSRQASPSQDSSSFPPSLPISEGADPDMPSLNDTSPTGLATPVAHPASNTTSSTPLTPDKPPTTPLIPTDSNLVDKYGLEITAFASNQYIPGHSRSRFSVSISSLSELPEISVSATISRAQKTVTVSLFDDTPVTYYPGAIWHSKYFSAGESDLAGLKSPDNSTVMILEDFEKLTAVITITVGNEKQTLTFYPEVAVAMS